MNTNVSVCPSGIVIFLAPDKDRGLISSLLFSALLTFLINELSLAVNELFHSGIFFFTWAVRFTVFKEENNIETFGKVYYIYHVLILNAPKLMKCAAVLKKKSEFK